METGVPLLDDGPELIAFTPRPQGRPGRGRARRGRPSPQPGQPPRGSPPPGPLPPLRGPLPGPHPSGPRPPCGIGRCSPGPGGLPALPGAEGQGPGSPTPRRASGPAGHRVRPGPVRPEDQVRRLRGCSPGCWWSCPCWTAACSPSSPAWCPRRSPSGRGSPVCRVRLGCADVLQQGLLQLTNRAPNGDTLALFAAVFTLADRGHPWWPPPFRRSPSLLLPLRPGAHLPPAGAVL